MAAIKSAITYFTKPGKVNTEAVIELVNHKAEELGVSTVLVASTTGYTAKLAVDKLKNIDVVIITHANGFKEPDTQEFDNDIKKYVESKGGRIVTAQHTFAGLNRAIRQSLGGYQPDEIIAYVLRLFGQGMKVVAEIAMMAADAGAVSCSKPVIAIAGTGRGADLGVVLTPTNTQRFFDLKIIEIFCMPSIKHPLKKDTTLNR